MTIEFIRHGQTAANAENRYVGSMDSPVSELGLRLAAQGHIQPEVELVYVTPLMRTQQTAQVLFPNARQVIVPGFREMNFGVFEGRTADELQLDPAFQVWSADGGLKPMEGGEGRLDFSYRVRDALVEHIAALKQRGETHSRLVCHGGVIMALMMHHATPERHWEDWWVENLTGHRVQVNPEAWGPEAKFLRHEPLDYGVRPQG